MTRVSVEPRTLRFLARTSSITWDRNVKRQVGPDTRPWSMTVVIDPGLLRSSAVVTGWYRYQFSTTDISVRQGRRSRGIHVVEKHVFVTGKDDYVDLDWHVFFVEGRPH